MAVDLRQKHFRFGIDELAENTHGWYAAEDTNPASGAIPVNTTFLLRFTEQEQGGTAANNISAQFRYRKNGGAWTNITTTTSVVKAVAAAALTNGGNCTKRLSGTGTFESTGAGQTETGTSGGANNDIVASGNSETECGLQIVGADVVGGDVLEFSLSVSPAITLDIIPSYTVGAAATRGLVSFTEFEAPLVPTRGLASFLECETPLVGTRGVVSMSELEIPLVPTRGLAAWLEQEAPEATTPTRGLLSWLEHEAPDVATPTRGLAGWVELEIPILVTRGVVSLVELEVPLVPSRGLLSLADFEAPSAPTRGLAGWLEFEADTLATRGWLAWAELEAPDVQTLTATRGLCAWVELETAGTLVTCHMDHWTREVYMIDYGPFPRFTSRYLLGPATDETPRRRPVYVEQSPGIWRQVGWEAMPVGATPTSQWERH